MPETQPQLPFDPPATDDLPRIIEALLFVAEEPPSAGTLARALGVPAAAVRAALTSLREELEPRGRRLQETNGTWQLVTAPPLARYVETFLGTTSRRLSRAALEVLSIVAYRQPCTRADVETIRGANSDRLMVTLEQRGLIEVIGTAEGPGRAKLYGPTRLFYEYFGITSPEELPPLPQPDVPADEAEADEQAAAF
jgi:segregation and condensation protein B